jgi:hypothetical protein
VALGKERNAKAAQNWRGQAIQSRPDRQKELTNKGTGQMFFNGFTLLLVFISLFVGFLAGVRYENNFMRERFNDWTNGESIEEQMKRDGWKV